MIDAAELARLRELYTGATWADPNDILALLDALEQALVRAEHLDWAHGRMVAERASAREEATLAEREACAKVAEETKLSPRMGPAFARSSDPGKMLGAEIAAAIRGRKP
jgi:hypothetical protein